MWWPPLPAFSFVLCPDCLSYSFLASAFICPVCFFSLLSSEGSHIHVFTEPRGNNTCFVQAVFTPVPSLYLVKYQEGLSWKLCPFSRGWLHINSPRLTAFIRWHKINSNSWTVITLPVAAVLQHFEKLGNFMHRCLQEAERLMCPWRFYNWSYQS